MQMKVDPDKIKRWREDRCWSQEHLADAAGISLRTVQRLENGESALRETVMALAAAFDVDVSVLAVDARREARASLRKQSAKNKRETVLAFWIHFATYIGVIALLFAINLSSSRDDLWAVWPAIGWGVGVFAHGATVMLMNAFSTDEEEINAR